jgi:hypothetical protein
MATTKPFLFAALLTLSACQLAQAMGPDRNHSIAGIWTSDENSARLKSPMFRFSSEGTEEALGYVKAPDGTIYDVEYWSTYRIVGNKLVERTNNAKLRTRPGADKATRSAVDSWNAHAAERLRKSPEQVSWIVWQDANTFEVTNVKDGHHWTTYTRFGTGAGGQAKPASVAPNTSLVAPRIAPASPRRNMTAPLAAAPAQYRQKPAPNVTVRQVLVGKPRRAAVVVVEHRTFTKQHNMH